MTLEELLNSINGELKALNDREEAGEDVSQEREQLTRTKASLENGLGGGSGGAATATATTTETELERLRREAREREEADLAKGIASQTLAIVRQDQEAQRTRMAEVAAAVVQEQLKASGSEGGISVEDAVRRVLEGQREGSRFVGQGATEDAAKAIAEGGQIADNASIRVGENREVKGIEDRGSMAEFMAIALRIKRGIATDAQKAFMAKHSKALAEGTDSAGGFLVPQQWMPDVLGLLRASAVVRRGGPRFQPILKQMNQTSISSGATAYYTPENAKITASEETFAEAPLLTPKNLTGLVPVSNYLLADTAQADPLVRADLAEVLALREDLAFLQGTGTGGEPTGMRNVTGRTQNPFTPGANGSALTLANVRRIRAYTRKLNAQNPRWVFFFSPEFISYLETLVDADGRFLADTNILQINPDQMSGRIDGIPFLATTQIPVNLSYGTATNATYLILANMPEVVVGINQELALDVSSEATYWDGTQWRSAFQENQTLFRAVMRHDIAPRRPTHVIVQEGVLIP